MICSLILLVALVHMHADGSPLPEFRIPGETIPDETPDEKFVRSDGNNDGRLSFDEFLHTDLPYDRIKKDEFHGLDTNEDGVVSREEYDEHLREEQEKNIDRKAKYFGKIFEDFDENFDMKISEPELVQIFADRFMLKPRGNFHRIFSSFDKNGDGALDIHEYMHMDKNMPFEQLEPIEGKMQKKAKLPLDKAQD